MIKSKTKDTIILGLSDENLKRLSDGQPIKFNLKDLDLPPMDVVIFNGRTEESMFLEMTDLMDLNKTKFK